MNQGEPLETSADEKSDAMDAASTSHAPHSPQADRSTVSMNPANSVDIAEHLSKTIETVGTDDRSDVDALDTEVQNLLSALADEEFGHDEAWVEVSQTVDSVEDGTLPDDLRDPLPYPAVDTGADGSDDGTAGREDAAPHADSVEDDADPAPEPEPEPEPEDHHWNGNSANRMSDDDFAADIAADITPRATAAPATDAATETVAGDSADDIENDVEDTTADAGADLVTDGRGETDAQDDVAPPTTPDLSDEEARERTEPDHPHDPAAQAMPDDKAESEPHPEAPRSNAPSAEMLGLQAIEMLGEKIAASEDRYDSALNKMGHALGVIAKRIDSLEARMTDQTIANVALAAAPPEIEDHSVAPYIARAERELKARKESGPMDIFDRIAQAAENEFDDRPEKGGAPVLANATDGRRVGTKKWQPSKTVKRRMEQLEKSRAGAPVDAVARPAARGPQTESEPGPALDPEDFAVQAKTEAQPAPEPIFDPEEEDDSGLSVLPGARGRRRNRARKSRLDEDFENVFDDESGKPSIQSLRRKMRERPVDEPETEEPAKGGMLSGLLGKKSARKTASAVPDPASLDDVHEDDEDDLLAVFDDPGEEVLKAPKRSKKSRHVEIDDEDDDDDGWDEEDTGASSKRKPLIYALIVAAAGAGVFAWKTFLG